ncbi:Similar to Putative ankyrin repeat protein MM_0045; acc. no. Q8Q0U0 [Pyronema omphalodes CBS 100304]|uniref:Similar to Putative ankyrin repeat protein MM_0045 acc. no. Q8Q0U0 n=1 Tax=Pyronema omphalodes (strain CBS 100304) TaxID=1076935 RepID=U4L9S7_PYROM|nr:Similar to Putative ankyrin repeat protein MM_0045; acc. no. Q8Q0U0 [Pyronema omphalodes CBS 100304]
MRGFSALVCYVGRLSASRTALVEKGADINAENMDGDTALFRAIRYNWHHLHLKNGKLAKLLIKKGADMLAQDCAGRSILSLAAMARLDKIVDLALYKGADIELECHQGRMALSYTASEAQEAVVELLLRCGANVYSRCKMGKHPVAWAAESGYRGITVILLATVACYRFAEDTTPNVNKMLVDSGADLQKLRAIYSISAQESLKKTLRRCLDKYSHVDSNDRLRGKASLLWNYARLEEAGWRVGIGRDEDVHLDSTARVLPSQVAIYEGDKVVQDV